MSAPYPRVSFGADIGYASNKILQGSNALTVAGGPLISWTFPNQAVARARIRQSKASTQAALATFDSTVLNALKETEQALSAYQEERVRWSALADAVRDSSLAYELSQKRQRSGALSQLDLLLAEQSSISARAALASSESRVLDDQVSLFKALGGGWGVSPDQVAELWPIRVGRTNSSN